MAVFGTEVDRPLYGRGPSPGLRFTLYAILALVLMYYDQRAQWVQRIRYSLQAAAYPVQVAVGSPAAAWRWLAISSETRSALQAENTRLRTRQRELELSAMRAAALEQENLELRALKQALPPLIKTWQLAEVVSVETDPLRQRLVINKGARNGVYLNEAVVDARGILGQVARIGPWSAEIILVTDPEHALPVESTRNGLRTIAVGSGNSGELLLPYVAVNSDVKSGDLLVSSGLGGVFPAGLPVARITGVRRESNQLTAQVRAQPLATIDQDREVMLLQFDSTHPAAPAATPAIAPLAASPPVRPAPRVERTGKPVRPGAKAGPPVPAVPARVPAGTAATTASPAAASTAAESATTLTTTPAPAAVPGPAPAPAATPTDTSAGAPATDNQ